MSQFGANNTCFFTGQYRLFKRPLSASFLQVHVLGEMVHRNPQALKVRCRILTVDSRAHRISRLIDQNTCVVVEPHAHSVPSLHFFLCSHNHRMSNVASSHLVRNGCAPTTPASTRPFAQRTLLLHHDYYAITYEQIKPVS